MYCDRHNDNSEGGVLSWINRYRVRESKYLTAPLGVL